MNGNANFLLDLAGAVSDGEPVDWAALSRSPEASSSRDLLEEMAILARVGEVHRTSGPPRSAAELTTPKTWGPLTLLERIGEGAFGEVFRARENRLDREVALKLLRPAGTDQAVHDAAATIEEGRLLARVRHPNVVTVHGAERIDGRIGIWTEFIDGHTLAALVAERGPMPAEEVVAIGIDLCRALGAVHQAGLLHRDIKAQNVMRETSGRIVLMDFGTGHDVRAVATRAGDLSGTPVYLAPELYAGGRATRESDVYALAVLLFYLLTGRYPVSGRTLGDLLWHHRAGRTSTLHDLRPDLPEPLVAAIERGLSPDPSQRYERATDFASGLESCRHGAEPTPADWRAAQRRTRRILVAAVVTIGCLLAAGYATRRWLVAQHPAKPTLAITQLTFNSPELIPYALAMAPNGKYLAYADRTGLVVQPLPHGQERHISLPSEASDINNLRWLPDSIGLLAAGPQGVWRTSLSGDPPRRILTRGGRIAVSPDGQLLAILNFTNTIRLTSLTGDDVREIDDPDSLAQLSEPFWSPDGRRIGYLRGWHESTGAKAAIETRLLDGGGRTVIVSGANGMQSALWTPDGRVLFARPLPPPQGQYQDLWEIHVDATGRPLGDPTSVWQPPKFTFIMPSLSVDGKRLAFLVRRDPVNVYWAEFDAQAVEMRGLRRATLADTQSVPLMWTPQGDAILLGLQSGGSRIYRQDLIQGEPQEVLNLNTLVRQAVVSPDGTWIYYLPFNRSDHVMRVPASGGSPQALFAVPAGNLPLSGQTRIRCSGASANVCFVGSLKGEHLLLTSLDPVRGTPGHQIELGTSPSWDLSQDGTQIVSLDYSGHPVQPVLLDLATQKVRRLDPRGWAGVGSVVWSADGKGWIVIRASGSSGSEVLYIDRAGQSRVLWTSPFQHLSQPMVSSDGRHLAFRSELHEGAIWMLQGF